MMFFHSLSSFFCRIFEIIIHYRQKTTKLIINNEKKERFSLKHNVVLKKDKTEEQNTTKKKLFYLLIIILYVVSSFCFIYRENILKSQSNPTYIQNGMKGVLILSSTLFCFLILKYRIERYKKAGIAIIMISFVFNGIMSIFESNKVDYITFLLEFLINFITSFLEVIEKYLMHFMFQSPYIILFF